ncbi:1-phosphofructokinase [Clostridia bacterium]|nr:1-phosphofructokinase [Clostridia bacterium]
MITTVTLNPAIDKSILLDEVVLGEVHRIKEVVETVGGKGINVSKVLNFFGVATTATGILGRDNADLFTTYLREKGIEDSFYQAAGKTRTNVKVNETKHQRTTDLNEPGLLLNEADIDRVNYKLVTLAGESDYMVLGGSLPRGADDTWYADIIRLVKDKTTVVLDTSGAKLKDGISAGADIIKPNKEELEQAYDVRFADNEECVEFCAELIRGNRLSTVLLTLGGEGAVFITEKVIYHSDPINVNVVNTVGAGDSFLGGYLTGKSIGKNNMEAFRIAVACGSLAVMQKGTDIFSKEEYDEMIEKVVVR